jgi:hypothetical protein
MFATTRRDGELPERRHCGEHRVVVSAPRGGHTLLQTAIERSVMRSMFSRLAFGPLTDFSA